MFRYSAYRNLTRLTFKWLGKKERRPIPACCTDTIRRRFPAPSGVYVPYDSAEGSNDDGGRSGDDPTVERCVERKGDPVC